MFEVLFDDRKKSFEAQKVIRTEKIRTFLVFFFGFDMKPKKVFQTSASAREKKRFGIDV